MLCYSFHSYRLQLSLLSAGKPKQHLIPTLKPNSISLFKTFTINIHIYTNKLISYIKKRVNDRRVRMLTELMQFSFPFQLPANLIQYVIQEETFPKSLMWIRRFVWYFGSKHSSFALQKHSFPRLYEFLKLLRLLHHGGHV